MTTTSDIKRAEVIKRLRMLGLPDMIIHRFEQNGKVMVSKQEIFSYEPADSELQKRIYAFEKSSGAAVYLCIESNMWFGRVVTMLYISDYPENWKAEQKMLSEGKANAYVYNYYAPECSEIGLVGVACGEVVIRTW